MRVYFHQGAATLSARAALLRQTLKDHFGPRAENSTTLEIADDADAARLELFLGLSGLHTGHGPDVSLFFGLTCAPEQMLGRNFLVCLRPLAEELADFERRFPQLTRESPQWCRDILRNFERCIFVNEADFRASVGFSPWVEMALAANVPVRLPRPRLSHDDHALDVAIFVHDAGARDQAAELHRALAAVSQPHLIQLDDPAELLSRHANSALHIHCGYAEAQDTPLINPFDSIVSGVYCMVYGQPGGLSSVLRQLFELRSYTQCYNSIDDLTRATQKTHERLLGLRESGVRFNPEIKRFETANQQFFEACIHRLEEQLT